MSRFKKIKKIDDFDDDNPDGCLFLLGYNEEMTEIILTLKANRPITPVEYFDSLNDFCNNVSENPDKLFVEDAVDGEDDLGLH